MSGIKEYTREEVSRSDGKTNSLFIIHDQVYDVHEFLSEHPGGEEILMDHRGKDASQDFDNIGHSIDAFNRMKKYHVGVLVEHEKRHTSPKKGWVAGYNSKAPEKYVKGPGVEFYLFVGTIIVVIIGVIYIAN